MGEQEKIQLRIPDQDLRYVTIGDTNPKKLATWIEELPMMNLGETSRRLYQLIQELNRVKLDPKTRFALLELLRPPMEHIFNALSKHFLNQSVVLAERERKVLNLAQSIQANMATGYKICVVHACQKLRDKELKHIATVGIHRAISSLTLSLCRCLQLYFQPPKGLWLELHQLYRLATYHSLDNKEVKDKQLKLVESFTISEAYARALTLAGCRPNQLRQNEITMAYDALEEWCGYIDVSNDKENAIFVIDPTRDLGPQYLNRAPANAEACLYLHSKELVEKLQQAESGASGLTIPDKMTPGLINHLSHSWGTSAERSFRRTECKIPVKLCLGLSALHHFISDGASFRQQLTGGKKIAVSGIDIDSQTSKLIEDAWDNALDGGSHSMASDIITDDIDLDEIQQMLIEEEEKPEDFVDFATFAINSSPGGYCLQWTQDVPPNLRTGEIIGIRESGQKWRVGVIRWVKQLAGTGAQFGIELLSPSAEAVGARVILKTGEKSQYQRCLLLPELAAIGQPATLITPALMFGVGSKANINRSGEILRVTLNKTRLNTPSVKQFQFKEIGVPANANNNNDSQTDNPNDEDFDSIWSSL